MQFLLGVLAAALFFVGYMAFKAGRRTTKKATVDDDAKQKARQMHKHFQELMSYDVSKARERKKVT